MPRLSLSAFLLVLLLRACSGGGPAVSEVFTKTLTLSGKETIYIEMHAGNLEVQPAVGQELGIRAGLVAPDLLEISQNDASIEIIHNQSQTADFVRVQVPEGSILKIKTFSADIHIEGFAGDLTVNSSAGKITIDQVAGSATAWAGRGEIAATDSQGKMVLISEHGAVRVENFSGEISLSTIMGSLVYHGAQNDQNTVRLEADHGSVTVYMPESANTAISASSTSGEVVCIGPNVIQTVDGCLASAGSGTGSITIRTVSGRVEVRLADSMGAE